MALPKSLTQMKGMVVGEKQYEMTGLHIQSKQNASIKKEERKKVRKVLVLEIQV